MNNTENVQFPHPAGTPMLVLVKHESKQDTTLKIVSVSGQNRNVL